MSGEKIETFGPTEMLEKPVGELTEEAYTDMIGYSEDEYLRATSEPRVEPWSEIVRSPRFIDDLYKVDEIFVDNSYDAELHVGRNSFGQVEIECQREPEHLRLMVSNPYQDFTDNVDHRFFKGMERDEIRRSTGSNLEIGFGGYQQTRELPLSLERTEIHIPHFLEYTQRTLEDAFKTDR